MDGLDKWMDGIDRSHGAFPASVARSLQGCPGKEQTGRMRQDFSSPLQIDGDRNSCFFRKIFILMYTIIVYIIVSYDIIYICIYRNMALHGVK